MRHFEVVLVYEPVICVTVLPVKILQGRVLPKVLVVVKMREIPHHMRN